MIFNLYIASFYYHVDSNLFTVRMKYTIIEEDVPVALETYFDIEPLSLVLSKQVVNCYIDKV